MQGGFARKYYTVEIFPVITSPTPNALSEQNATPAVKNVFDYDYEPSAEMHHHAYLIPALHRAFARASLSPETTERLFDLGCGNGALAAHLAAQGYTVTGVDPAEAGIKDALSRYASLPAIADKLSFYIGSAYDDLAGRYGSFPAVISSEVVEHLYDPATYAAELYRLTEPGGVAIVTTPYHGYWKNLVLALTGKMDAHFAPMWHHGHIKFWSEATIRELLEKVGFTLEGFERAGRIPVLAKSMIAIARKPL